ncbi:MAG: hypothetical protein RIC29_14610 [Rhodospirillaceae bacterium]
MLDQTQLDYVKDLPGFERGHPHYFKDPMIDHLLEIVMLIGGELWVERDRRMITEHLMETEGHVTAEMIEQFVPDDDMAAKLKASRNVFTKRVFGCLYDNDTTTNAEDFFNVIGKDG